MWAGDPLLETAERFRIGRGDEDEGIGIEFLMGRNKFGGKVTRLERDGEVFSMDFSALTKLLGSCVL